MTTTTTDTQRRFAALYREKLELQDRLNIVNHEVEDMQESLLNYFADAGQSKTTIDGLTLYVETTLWANAKPGESEAACAALVANGYADFVHPTFNVQTLSAAARELEKQGETFPEAVLAHLDVKAKIQIRGRRSA